MADEQNMGRPAANGHDADRPADDLQSLLDNLAVELTGAGARHTESLNHMQGRVAALSDRASTVKPSLPHEYGAAIDRIEAAMSSFSERLSDAEPRTHAAAPADGADAALPEAVRAEVRDAILNAQLPEEGRPPAAVAAYPAALPHAIAAAAPPMSEPSWLEKRFSDIAGRLKQSIATPEPHNALQAIETRFGEFEQRFDNALGEITSRSDAASGSLKGIEQQIGELVTQFGRTEVQLGRLEAIERRIGELRRDIPDEQMNRLVGALTPSDEKLSALAMAAAEHTAASIRKEMAAAPPPAPPQPVSDPRLVELTTMLDTFISEQRQGEAQNAEALDTMQQAMQHLIDRVEAIEAAQTSNHQALMRARVPVVPEAGAFSVRSAPPPHLTPSALTDAPALAATAEPAPRPMSELTATDAPAPSRPRPEAQGPSTPAAPVPGERDRQAMIAMARRAAEKVSSEPPRTAGPAARAAAGQRHSRLPRPGLLLVLSFTAFLLAGFWLVAGPGLRAFVPGTTTTKTGDASHVIDMPERVSEPTEPAQDETAASEPVKRANLATPVEPPQQQPIAPISVSTADLAAAVAQDARAPASSPLPSETPGMSRSVEMPPAMIGPTSLRSAAAKGDAKAQFEVAARYAEGKGVPKDFAQAAIWYQRAAAQGMAMAQYRLAALYERGLGVAADPGRARAWYARAAAQGNVRAMHNLAVLGAGRPGMSPDYATAVQWFTEAANRGLADSQYNLGILYESGLGVPANNIEAYKWYALAARSGDKDATRRRDVVREKLDASSLREADVLVIQWRAVAVENDANDVRGMSQTRQAGRQ